MIFEGARVMHGLTDVKLIFTISCLIILIFCCLFYKMFGDMRMHRAIKEREIPVTVGYNELWLRE